MTICFLCEADRLLCNGNSLLCKDQGKSTVNDRCDESQNSYNRIANADSKFGEEMPPSRLNILSLVRIPSRRRDTHFYRKSPSAIRSRSLKLCNVNLRYKGGKENVFWRDFGLISAIGLPRLTRLNVGKRHVSHSNFYQLWQPLNG